MERFRRTMFRAATLFLLLTPAAAQNLKNDICIVREQLGRETKDWLAETAEYLKSKGYSRYARGFEELDGSTFGSGFVVSAGGRPLVVTNRHVVSAAEGAKVQFERADGTLATIEGLKVIATDKDLDLALLEFPAGAQPPNRSGMRISSAPLADGDEIWTAGFPGIAGNPSWQLGRGNVSNASTRIKELVDPAVSVLIQHSAPVDAGNSGGPLLRLRGGVYEVVGVNTWKVNWRQSTNLSMPAAALQRFIQGGAVSGSAKLEERVKALCDELREEEVSLSNIEKFIGKDNARDFGAEHFVSALRTGSSADRAFVVGSHDSHPVSGLSAASAVNLKNRLLKDGFIKNCEAGAPESRGDGSYAVEMTSGGTSVVTVWRRDGGGWTVSGFGDEIDGKADGKKPGKAEKASGKSKDKSKGGSSSSGGFEVDRPYFIAASGGYLHDLSRGTHGGGVKLHIAFSKFFGFQLEADFLPREEGLATAIAPAMRLNIPLNFGRAFVMPYGAAGVLVSFGKRPKAEGEFPPTGETDFGMGFAAGGGIEAGWKFDNRLAVFAFGEYAYKGLSFFDKENVAHGPFVGVGIAYGF